ncbi:antitoxin [Patescibacteria group bacterium]|nr:antitoxin [Patescibacteria group bacterium]
MKMKKNKKRDIFAPLDRYEEELIKAIDSNEVAEVPNQDKEMNRYRAYVEYTLNKIKKDKRVTIRVEKKDLESIQKKAIKTGIPYQTLIASILRKFAQGEISIGV